MSIALVFSGQGAQHPGMGQDLYENNAAARAIFQQAPGEIIEDCFHGDAGRLAQTEITQPCVYTVTMAAFAAFKTLDIPYERVAGFSLGEFVALCVAGVFDFATGLELVTNRGQYMAECAGGKGGMTAVLGSREKLLTILSEIQSEGFVLPVNYNSPSQTVVAGYGQAYQEFSEKAAEIKLKAIPLKVGGAFHSPMMEPASQKLRELLKNITLREPEIPIYSNVTAENMQGKDLMDLIARQAMSPVLWEQTIRKMIADGTDTFIEIGVGNTLCGLIRKTDRSVKTYQIESCASLEETARAIKGGN